MAGEKGIPFDECSAEELARGFRIEDSGDCLCLHCRSRFEAGLVYPVEGGLALAERAARDHVQASHGGPFEALLSRGVEAAGLTGIQAYVMRLMYEGMGDREIAQALGGKSESTVRNHRYNLRKRVAEARVFLALATLLEERMPTTEKDKFIEYPASLPTRDDRTLVTEAEAAAIEARCLDKPGTGRLRILLWPKKQKEKLVVLRRVAELFEPGHRYTEGEVNAILIPVLADHVTLRRYLIEYRFLDREADGSAYWRG